MTPTIQHRRVVATLALVSLLLAGLWMGLISRSDPWYRNTEMNIHIMADALALNSDVAPNPFAQPAVPLKYLLALNYRLQHELGLLPVWNLRKLGQSRDPLQEFAPLIHAGRLQQGIFVLLFILASAVLTYTVTREFDTSCLTVILLSGSAGLLFHGLLLRPELMCVGFGNIFALICIWKATTASVWRHKQLWLFGTGVCVGLAALEKLPGIMYLIPCVAWCWFDALIKRNDSHDTETEPVGLGSGLIPAAVGASVLWLLFELRDHHEALGSVVVMRLRIVAVLVVLLPLIVLLIQSRPGLTKFLCGRLREFAALGAGLLVTLPLTYLLLRCVLSESPASDYLTGVLHFIVNPAPYVEQLAPAAHLHEEFLLSLRDNPLLYICAPAFALQVSFVRTVSWRHKAFILIMPAIGMGLLLLLSRRHYFAQYSIFSEVPLLLVWPLGLSALRKAWESRQPGRDTSWMAALVIAGVVVSSIGVYLKLQPKYYYFQDDASLPVNQFTVTFLFDHDAHPRQYLQIMREHYHDRNGFEEALERYLADLTHRY